MNASDYDRAIIIACEIIGAIAPNIMHRLCNYLWKDLVIDSFLDDLPNFYGHQISPNVNAKIREGFRNWV